MGKGRNYEEFLGELLQKSEEAEAYLQACLEDENPEVFLLALRDVADAQLGMKEIEHKSKLNKESLYKTLSEKRNPELKTIQNILDSLGYKLIIKKRKKAKKYLNFYHHKLVKQETNSSPNMPI